MKREITKKKKKSNFKNKQRLLLDKNFRKKFLRTNLHKEFVM